jgi:mannose-6-phosphate isomerase-like protein (cupin superfamily)
VSFAPDRAGAPRKIHNVNFTIKKTWREGRNKTPQWQRPTQNSFCLEVEMKVNVAEKLELFHDHWSPKIVGEVNNIAVKLVKFQGEFVWHHHKLEDEMFFVISGEFDMEFRDKTVHLAAGEFLIVPKGLEHRPVAQHEVAVMLIEPNTVLNTGNVLDEKTVENLERI